GAEQASTSRVAIALRPSRLRDAAYGFSRPHRFPYPPAAGAARRPVVVPGPAPGSPIHTLPPYKIPSLLRPLGPSLAHRKKTPELVGDGEAVLPDPRADCTSFCVLWPAALGPDSRGFLRLKVAGFRLGAPWSDAMNCEVCHLKELEVEVFQVREVLRCEFSSSSLRFMGFKSREQLNCCSLRMRILHTILFHRALGLVRPKDVDAEVLDITYVQCGNAEIEKKIEEKVDNFYGWMEKHPNKKGQVCFQHFFVSEASIMTLTNVSTERKPIFPHVVVANQIKHKLLLVQILLSFYELKNKHGSWFGNKLVRHDWEQWYINLHILQPKVHGKSHSSKAALHPREANQEESRSRHAALEASLHEVMFQIIKFANDKKDHIPPVSNLEGVSFPYEITIPRFVTSHTYAMNSCFTCSWDLFITDFTSENSALSHNDSSFGVEMFKRMLQTGHPSMLS
ncbi:hypothetical protein Taro_018154, partial [Colocasia esculenta]|nr:hypothetical protein [Colocasia esculenta]